jgi:hypothetical protein
MDTPSPTLRVAPIQVLTRLEPHEFDRLEQWRRAQQHIPSRSDALRALLRRALAEQHNSATAA